ncbi:RNA polymerase sigma factor [Sphingobacterium faecale]|uniref:RNA polymerase sigma-70 factor n=1 Tax=Sphingobacterium faecale TaxID=2803775 RepID=A0ABS1R269_9SPHI|nr:RNA polymerase sigma-70 factor [Sphingobacterium faecale]MBL1408354.1 RNA polymerase sigma-70 factor [Sphingobacterium faecale]
MKIIPLNDEQKLLEELKRGEERAFNILYGYYSVPLYGNILKMVRDQEVANDIHQDLFAKIWQKRANIDLEKSFRSFLFTCAKYQIYDYLKRVDISQQVNNYISFRNTELYSHVEEDLALKETESLYQTIIDQLPSQCQKVYKLVKHDGLSYEQAATELGISSLTVRNHLAKATRTLKEQMGPHVIILLLLALGN